LSANIDSVKKMTERARVLALEPDLIFSSKIESTTREMGVSLTVVADVPALARELTDKNTPQLLVIDLDAVEGNLVSLKQVLTGKTCTSAGYCSHVNTRLVEEAKQSGVGLVFSRGMFVRNFQTILARALRQ
jgi:hypothetical protein